MNMGSTFDMQQDIRTKSKHEIIDYTDTMLYKREIPCEISSVPL